MGTIMVGITLNSFTMSLRIAVVTRAATTSRPMILAIAFRVDGAFVVQDTRIHALAIIAGSCVVTLAVRFTIKFKTS